jgi:hypothetical protein
VPEAARDDHPPSPRSTTLNPYFSCDVPASAMAACCRRSSTQDACSKSAPSERGSFSRIIFHLQAGRC